MSPNNYGRLLHHSPEDECVVPVDTSYEAGPWDTWEEPTEQLDPLCCVCMV